MASPTPKPFVYLPLTKSTNIRLIVVHAGSTDASLTMGMFEATSPDQDYWALSYVWGDSSGKLPVMVNGQTFMVTKNLHNFLTNIRSPTGPTRALWADAICINQQDSEEKSFQVGMMNRIYSKTSLCLVWLGERAETHTELGCLLLEDKVRRLREEYDKLHAKSPIEFPLHTGSDYLFEFTTALEHSDTFRLAVQVQMLHLLPHKDFPQSVIDSVTLMWQGLYNIWTRPWFQRIWTLQEFVLPGRVHFRVGPYGIAAGSLAIFSRAFQLYSASGQLPPDYDEKTHQAFQRVSSCCRARIDYQFTNSRPHILNHICRQQVREASNSRDKIFGILGMTQTKSINVDYGKPVAQIYHDFAVWCMKEKQTALIMQFAIRAKEVKNLPSWVPDWSYRRRLPEEPLDRLQYSAYKGAGGPDNGAARFSDDMRTLWIEAVLIGSVEHIIEANHDAIEECVGSLESFVHPSDQSIREVMYRVSSTEIMISHGIPHRTGAESIMHLIVETSESTPLEPYRFAKREEGVANQPFQGFKRLEDFTTGRIFFVTSEGHIGLGSKSSLAIGDQVAVIRGATLPMILRRKDTHYEVVDGENYVHGVMDGEIMKDVAAGKRVMEEIEIW